MLDETNISGCLHFSMQYIEMSCDLDPASRRSNINVSQQRSLFIEICVTSFTYRHTIHEFHALAVKNLVTNEIFQFIWITDGVGWKIIKYI